jgi:mannose-1-phosphate guanylyltransferase
MIRVAVIMAGGVGERFWPLSRASRPKQLQDLTGAGVSLLRATVDRIAPVIPPERILVVTGAEQAEGTGLTLPDLPPDNILVEPSRRNTAACIGLACAQALAKWGEDISLVVLPSDHLIAEEEEFRGSVAAALEFAENSGGLVTVGIEADRPETGYGYIEAGETVVHSTAAGDIHPVARFVEKPDKEKAREYITGGQFFWNSGMFFWTAKAFLDGLSVHMQALAGAVDKMTASLSGDVGNEEMQKKISEIYGKLDYISIDYGLIEKADNVYVLPADFGWDDIGSWDSLGRIRSVDEKGNVVEGDPVLIDSEDCVVLNEAGSDRTMVALLGVRDLVVVATGDALLVCPRSRTQEIRKIVETLRDRGDKSFT